jgi:ubiquinol oxidase
MTSTRPSIHPSNRLVELQQETLSTPRLRYGIPARALFACLDLVYGKPRTLAKFRMLELLARVPYQSWEHGGYIAVTRRSGQPNHARQVFSRVQESREQQDNEQWHLLILEELTRRSGDRETYFKHRLLPEVIAFFYYRMSLLLYLVRPAWSHRLNADFEDHAEHEYMLFVQEHPELEHVPFQSDFADDYGRFASLADLFRQIGHDERVHKEESLAAMSAPRFR